MNECSVCGKPASWRVTKKFRLFPAPRRLLCDACLAEAEQREDRALLIHLVLATTLVGVTLYLQLTIDSQAGAPPPPPGRHAARDFDRDGELDLWEVQATDSQVEHFARLGYPWEAVESGNLPTRAFVATMPVEDWVRLYSGDREIRNAVNFPDVMDGFVKRHTDKTNSTQLDRVFLTVTRELGYIVRRYEKPPSEWPTPAPTPEKAAAKKPATPAPPPVPVIDVWVGYEPLTISEGKRMAAAFNVPPEKLPLPYREGY
ncbi:hypothetical protein K8I61_20150 [bacterium]|nr:hypothetical protein [bacterium]